jgi:hypothetical protein
MFWRIDDVDKERTGVEFLQKPTMLLLQEDWKRDSVEAFIRGRNEDS